MVASRLPSHQLAARNMVFRAGRNDHGAIRFEYGVSHAISAAARRVCAVLADAVWTSACAVCGRPLETGDSVCTECTRGFMPISNRCSRCSYPVHRGTCSQLPPQTEALIVVSEYSAARGLVFAFKYGKNRSIGRFLAGELGRTCAENPWFRQCDVVLPVPLHVTRKRTREFNQAEILAEAVAHALRIPCFSDCLRRSRNTPYQAGIASRETRRANVEGAFSVCRSKDVEGKHVLLVDDVVTTGATVSAVAAVLLNAGAQSVSVAAIAHPFHPLPTEAFDATVWNV